MATNGKHPCQTCGACCASLRVAFHWREAEIVEDQPAEKVVPIDFTEDLNADQRCMKGTSKKHQPKCICLMGKVGESAHCLIYENRPTPCRSFKASYEDGFQQPKCDEARAKHGLRPLTKADFKSYLLTFSLRTM